MPDFGNMFGTVEVTQPEQQTTTTEQTVESSSSPAPTPNYGPILVVAAVIGVAALTAYAIWKVD